MLRPPTRYQTAAILPVRCAAVKCLDCTGLPHTDASLAVDWRVGICPCLPDLGGRRQLLAAGGLQLPPPFSGFASAMILAAKDFPSVFVRESSERTRHHS